MYAAVQYLPACVPVATNLKTLPGVVKRKPVLAFSGAALGEGFVAAYASTWRRSTVPFVCHHKEKKHKATLREEETPFFA